MGRTGTLRRILVPILVGAILFSPLILGIWDRYNHRSQRLELLARTKLLAGETQVPNLLVLADLANCLEEYRQTNGAYPRSPDWVEVRTCGAWGGPDTPACVEMGAGCNVLCIYRSTGEDFKLSCPLGGSASLVRERMPELMDLVRSTGFGAFWSPGAFDW